MEHESRTFRFINYNIDYLDLKTARGLILRDIHRVKMDFEWATDLAIRDAEYMSTSERYIGGLEIRLRLLPKEGTSLDGLSDLQEEPLRSGAVLSVEMGIRGVFQIKGECYSAKDEEFLTSCHIPALLLPYARAALTGCLGFGGYPHFVLPLLNMHQVAKNRPPVKVHKVDG